jgi:hypothetical protein
MIFSWSPNETPPISSAMESLWCLPYFSKLVATWSASSRVGSRISERGIRAFARPWARMSIIGSVKAAVLPVPVCAVASTSRPIRICGMAAAWMGVGWV